MKIYNPEINVYEAFNSRVKDIFDNFDNICINFSGGKDSGVLLNCIVKYMRENNITKKISVFHFDYEGQYEYTQEYLEREMTSNLDLFDVYWVCIPCKALCGVSMHQSYWTPWHPDQEDIWVRKMPKYDSVINIDNHEFDFYKFEMQDTDFGYEFYKWLHKKKKAEKSIYLLGLRSDESLNRYRASVNNKKQMFNGWNWSTKLFDNIYWAYPLYDWTVEDIWVANAKFEFDYNKLYDLYYKAGLSIAQMRVASAFLDEGVGGLKLHKAIEPNIWSRLIGRVNGANFASIYGGTKAMGFRKITIPKGHTWKSYCDFLLSTLPKETSELYKKKFENSFKVWMGKGGALEIHIVDELKEKGYNIEILGTPVKNVQYNSERILVRFNEYPDDMKVSDFKNLPSYKRMCITILKNDFTCKYMGYAQTKYEKEIRNEAENKYKNIT